MSNLNNDKVFSNEKDTWFPSYHDQAKSVLEEKERSLELMDSSNNA